MVFVVEGIGQTDGIIAQPLIYYFKEVHSWTPVQVTAALTAFNFPWIIKPIYGLVSDFVPLFGYRRKSYLILEAWSRPAPIFSLRKWRRRVGYCSCCC